MTLEEFFKDERFVSQYAYDFSLGKVDTTTPKQRVRMVLKDGEQMSVQASEYHYCYPRHNFSLEDMICFGDKYYEYEVGFPSFVDAKLLNFAEEPNDPKCTVYGYVDGKLIERIIAAHGGIDAEKTLERLNKKEEK